MPSRQIAVLFQRSTAARNRAIGGFVVIRRCAVIELGLRQSARTKFVKGVARSRSDGGGNGRSVRGGGRSFKLENRIATTRREERVFSRAFSVPLLLLSLFAAKSAEYGYESYFTP